MCNGKHHTFIIAEVGINHNGSEKLAMRLIDLAKEAGADAVKFQTFKAGAIASRQAQIAAYQEGRAQGSTSQLAMLKKYEFNEATFMRLFKYCRERGIMFLSTAFDLKSLEFLLGLGMAMIKIPSGEITNLPYLEQAGRQGKKVILSTGMATLGEIEAAINILAANGTKQDELTVLHCTTQYPAPYQEVNLLAMPTLGRAFGVRVGYSDHTRGIEVPIAAAAMGAAVIEKHFTLGRNMEGPDHKASLEPGELVAMVKAIRNVEAALGDGLKKPSPSEVRNIAVARKSIVAARAIRKGERFTAENLSVKRPGSGISPMRWYEVLGRTAARDFERDELIEV